MGGIFQPVSFRYVPTFFHNGGIFLLQYFDQCDRDGPQIIYQNENNGILMKIVLDETYMALYDGSESLIWRGESGKTMTWTKTVCWPNRFDVPSTPLVGIS